MKIFIMLMLTCFICIYTNAQNSNIGDLKNYYQSLDKDMLVEKILTRYNESNSDFPLTKNDVGIHMEDEAIISLELKTSDISNYDYKKDIYDFIVINPQKSKIFSYDNGYKILFRLDAEHGYYKEDVSAKDKANRFDNVWKKIKEINADAYMIDNWILKEDGGENINFGYLKDGKIYVYRMTDNVTYELNEFIHKFFKEEEFKQKSSFYEKDLIMYH